MSVFLISHPPLTTWGITLFRCWEQLSDTLDQLVETHRLCKAGVKIGLTSGANFCRNDSDFDRGEPAAGPCGKRKTIDRSRHMNVSQKQPDVVYARQQGNRLVPGCGFNNRVPRIPKFLRQMQPDENFVLDDQYRTLCQELALSCGRRFDFVSPIPHTTLNGPEPHLVPDPDHELSIIWRRPTTQGAQR